MLKSIGIGAESFRELTLVPVSFCVYIFFVGIFHCTNPYNL